VAGSSAGEMAGGSAGEVAGPKLDAAHPEAGLRQAREGPVDAGQVPWQVRRVLAS
jgi:hypothetical protein